MILNDDLSFAHQRRLSFDYKAVGSDRQRGKVEKEYVCKRSHTAGLVPSPSAIGSRPGDEVGSSKLHPILTAAGTAFLALAYWVRDVTFRQQQRPLVVNLVLHVVGRDCPPRHSKPAEGVGLCH
jgi:hypothetical protein